MKLSNETRDWLLKNRRHGCAALTLIDKQSERIAELESHVVELEEAIERIQDNTASYLEDES